MAKRSKVYEPPLSLLYSQQFSLREAQAFVDFCVELMDGSRVTVELVHISTRMRRAAAIDQLTILIPEGTPYQQWSELFGRMLRMVNNWYVLDHFPEFPAGKVKLLPFLFSVLVASNVTPCTDIHAASVVAKWRPIFAEARRAGKPITA